MTERIAPSAARAGRTAPIPFALLLLGAIYAIPDGDRGLLNVLAGRIVAAALGATLTGRPVSLRLNRTQDITMTGKRHGFHATWKVGFDDAGWFEAGRHEYEVNVLGRLCVGPPAVRGAPVGGDA